VNQGGSGLNHVQGGSAVLLLAAVLTALPATPVSAGTRPGSADQAGAARHLVNVRQLPVHSRNAAPLDLPVLTKNPAALRRLKSRPASRTSPQSHPLFAATLAASAPSAAEEQLSEFPAMDLLQQINRFGVASQGTEPPDAQLAVGPTYVMEMVNRTASIWTKSGTLVMAFDLNPFFFDPSFHVPSDFQVRNPQLVFDAPSQRWFASVTGAGQVPNVAILGHVYLAVSASSDPTGLWYRGDLVPRFSHAFVIPDHPMLGINDDKVVVSWSDFSAPPCNGQNVYVCYDSTETYVLAKAALEVGNFNAYCVVQATTCSASNDGDVNWRFAIVPVRSLSATSTEYLVYNDSDPTFLVENQCPEPNPPPLVGNCPKLGIVTVNGIPGTPGGSPGTGTVQIGEFFLPMPPTTSPPDAAQPNTSALVVTGDDRLLSAVWEQGKLWTSLTDGNCPSGLDPTTGNPVDACVRLLEYDPAVTTVDLANHLELGDTSQDAYQPAVSMDAAGNMFTIYTMSNGFGANPGPIVSGLQVGQSNIPGLSFVIGAQSVGPYDSAPCGGHARWGDYLGMAQDPSVPTDVWAVAEWVPTSNTCVWGTAVVRLTFSGPSIKLLTPSAGPPFGNLVDIKGSDFFDQPSTSVKFGTQAASFRIVSPDELVAVAPRSSASTFPTAISVTVTTENGSTDPTAAIYTYVTRSEAVVPPVPPAAGRAGRRGVF
jgi:hypothetical protein